METKSRRGDLYLQSDIEVWFDDDQKKIEFRGDATGNVARKYGLPSANGGSIGTSGYIAGHEDLSDLYPLFKLRILAQEIDESYEDHDEDSDQGEE